MTGREPSSTVASQPASAPLDDSRRRDLEQRLAQVYDYCPPTQTFYRSPEDRIEYQRFWGVFLGRVGVGPERFKGARVLDAGCGSCEKAAFYHDWGGRVTGIDLTKEVLDRGRQTLAGRNVELIHTSIFDFDRPGQYDLAIVDGVSFITVDTKAALAAAVRQLKPGGVLVFSMTNKWGSMWWFGAARWVTGLLGGSDFHKRALWGRRLFLWTRRSQEGTSETSAFYRSEQSWAYDWFGPPVYRLHSPGEVLGWLDALGLTHLGSAPSLIDKDPPTTFRARAFRALTGSGRFGLRWYWIANRAPNMLYVAGVKQPASQ